MASCGPIGNRPAPYAANILYVVLGLVARNRLPRAKGCAMNTEGDDPRARRLTRDSNMVFGDRRILVLNTAQWKAFVAAMDAPPRPLPRLERLLKEPGFFGAGHAR